MSPPAIPTTLFFSNSTESSIQMVCILTIFWTLAAISVILRFWTRGYLTHTLGIDDWTMLFAMILFTVFTGISTAFVFMAGFGNNFFSKPLSITLTSLVVGQIMYVFTIMTLKISMGFFFLRILTAKWQKYFIYTLLSLVVAVSFTYFFYLLFECGVPNPYWVRAVEGHCADSAISTAIGYTHAILTATTDLVLALLPIPMISKTKLRRKEKFIIVGIIMVGALGSVASFVRLQYIKILSSNSISIINKIPHLSSWSTIELGLCTIAGSLCTLRPLLQHFRHRLRRPTGTYSSTVEDTHNKQNEGPESSNAFTPSPKDAAMFSTLSEIEELDEFDNHHRGALGDEEMADVAHVQPNRKYGNDKMMESDMDKQQAQQTQTPDTMHQLRAEGAGDNLTWWFSIRKGNSKRKGKGIHESSVENELDDLEKSSEPTENVPSSVLAPVDPHTVPLSQRKSYTGWAKSFDPNGPSEPEQSCMLGEYQRFGIDDRSAEKNWPLS